MAPSAVDLRLSATVEHLGAGDLRKGVVAAVLMAHGTWRLVPADPAADSWADVLQCQCGAHLSHASGDRMLDPWRRHVAEEVLDRLDGAPPWPWPEWPGKDRDSSAPVRPDGRRKDVADHEWEAFYAAILACVQMARLTQRGDVRKVVAERWGVGYEAAKKYIKEARAWRASHPDGAEAK